MRVEAGQNGTKSLCLEETIVTVRREPGDLPWHFILTVGYHLGSSIN